MSLYEDTVGTLNKKLTSLMEAKATGEQKLQKFHRKLGRIRVAVTKEINKVINPLFFLSVSKISRTLL